MPKFVANIDLNKNQLENTVVHLLASAPGSPAEGQIYYDTTMHEFGYYDGSAWVYSSTATGLPLSGGTMTGPIAMGSHKITGLTNGSSSADAVAFGQLGSAAFQNSTAFDASGAAATAQSTAEAFATSAVGTETTRAEAAEALLAPLASPALTGAPTAPTKTALTNNTDIATTAYADSAVGVETSRATAAEALALPLAGGTMSGVIAMGSHKITGLTNGSGAQDAAAFGQTPAGGTNVTIAQGGTGQTTQQAALDALAGGVTTAQVLAGNGTHVTLRALVSGDIPDISGTYLKLTGGTMAGAIAMGTSKITGLGNGSLAQDAVAFGQLGSAAFVATSTFDASGTSAAETTRAEATEALLAPLASPALTGTPTAPTKTALTNNTDIATTAYTDTAVGVETSRATAAEALKAPLASPALTGAPTAPTQSALTNNTDIATTAYADAAVAVEASRATTAEALALPKTGGTMSGNIAMGSHSLTNVGSQAVTLPWMSGYFGDGSDGSLTYDGTTTILGMAPSSNVYTLTRDIFATNLTINNGVTIKPAGYRFFCQGTFTNNGTVNGAGATGLASGSATASTGAGTLGAGRAGSSGQTTTGNAGTQGGPGTGSTSGAGGNGNTGGTNAGGVAVQPATSATSQFRAGPAAVLSGLVQFGQSSTTNPTVLGGGSSGGGGGGDGANKGGGGGGGGAAIVIFAWAIVNNGSFISTGGNGGSPATGICGGGGGGCGGLVLGYSLSAWTAGTITLTGGTGGTHIGSGGTDGGNGSAGNSLNVVVS